MSKFALLFLLLFFGGLVSAIFVSPVFAVMLYQLVYFMNPETRWWGASIPNLPYSFITVLAMLAALTFKYSEVSKFSKWREQSVLKWIVILLSIYFLMQFVAVEPFFHKIFTYDFAKLVIIIFIVYKLISKERDLNMVVWSYVVGAAYIGYYAGFVGRNESGRVEDVGMIDTGGDGNYTAAALVPAVIMLIYYVWTGRFRSKLIGVICAGLIVNGLILINSRGAFIGCVAGGLYFLCFMLFSSQQKSGQRLTAIIIILFGLAGAFSLTDETFWARMSTLKEVEDGDASGSHRVEFWLATFDVMRDFPLGVGVQGFERVSPLYLPEHYLVNGNGKAVHSTWFQLIAEAGWHGFIIFLALLVSLYKNIKNTKNFLIKNNLNLQYFHVLSMEAAFLGYLVAATFINRIRAESLWWCILFLMIATNIYYLQYKNGHKKIESLKDETEKKRS